MLSKNRYVKSVSQKELPIPMNSSVFFIKENEQGKPPRIIF